MNTRCFTTPSGETSGGTATIAAGEVDPCVQPGHRASTRIGACRKPAKESDWDEPYGVENRRVSSCPSGASSVRGWGGGGGGRSVRRRRRWSIEPVPKPPNSGDTELSGVSCTSTRACVAVGWRDVPATNDPVPLVERWNGSTWSTEHTPMSNTAGWSGSLSAVSCASSSACVAVGLSYGDNSSSGPFAERWDGSSWSIERIPQLGDAEALDGVSCASSTDCTAVGYGKSSVAAHWNGTRWSAESIHFGDPDGRPNALTSVSCTPSSCAAVGWDNVGLCGGDSTTSTASPYLDLDRPELVAAAASKCRGSNSSDPAGGYTVDGVSCTSPGACTAVGTAVYRWEGHRWSIQPGPTGADGRMECPAHRRMPARRSGPGSTPGTVSTGRACGSPPCTGHSSRAGRCLMLITLFVRGGRELPRPCPHGFMLVESIGIGATPAKPARRANACAEG